MEIWKPVHLEYYKDYYDVSDKGNVRSNKTKKGKILNQHYRCGYKAVYLENNKLKKRKTINVHKLVANSFLKKSNLKNPIVNHKDGDKMNNNVDNIEWVTYSENVIHAIKNGLMKPYKLPVLQYDMNNNFIAEYESIAVASKLTNCSDARISSTCKGKVKSHKNFIWKYKNDMNSIILNKNTDNEIIKNFPNYLITKDGKIYSKSHKRYLKFFYVQSI